MPQSIIVARRLDLSEAAWRAIRHCLRSEYWNGDHNVHAASGFQSQDIEEALKAVNNSPVISETVNPAEEPNEIDAWVIDATSEGRDVR